MKQITMVGFVLMAFIYSSVASACCEMRVRGSVEKGEVINVVCPVMGGKVDKDTPYKTEYKDKIIGFCCPGCIPMFNANPEKYMVKLQEKCIIKCPECAAEIDVIEECRKMGCPMMEKMKPADESEGSHEGQMRQ